MFVSKHHNHGQCISKLKTKLSKLKASQVGSLNENENRVITVLMNSHRALGAYEITRLASDDIKQLQPNQVYRAIEKLTALNLVHKVKTEGGYIACHAEDNCTTPVFLICTSCHQIAETENTMIGRAVEQAVGPVGFVLQHQNVELTGLCPNCS